MKVLTKSAITIQAFFKIAKGEQELQQDNFFGPQPTHSYLSYFNNKVWTTLPRTAGQFQNPPPQTFTNFQPSNLSYRLNPPNVRLHPSNLQASLPESYNLVSQRTHDPSSDTLHQHTRQHDPCSICHRINHRTIDCYYKKLNGCWNCGHSGHRVRDCLCIK
ncbi:unnamed protein product [Didymodactylos carnosus]|nr:unnamed protein product [Didymodactylos carnosus]CAF4077882.1 unnamed protein product [Didymodactylos carnosus]